MQRRSNAAGLSPRAARAFALHELANQLPAGLAVDDRVELEYREVLARPRLGIERGRREAFLAILQFQEHVTALPWPHRAPPDEDDTVFLEVAMQTSARTVVTGNLKHFSPACRGPVTVWSPRAAWEHFVHLRLT